jgi:hypothetical protein
MKTKKSLPKNKRIEILSKKELLLIRGRDDGGKIIKYFTLARFL